MSSFRQYHIDFRRAEIERIVNTLDGGKSVAVTGPPSVGKSNVLKFLDQDRMPPHDPNSPWKRFAPRSENRGTLISVMVDPNALLPPLSSDGGTIAARSWPGFELVAHRTYITDTLYPVDRVTPVDEDEEIDEDAVRIARKIQRSQDRFNNAHPRITSYNDSLHGHLALRHLENLIEAALDGHAVQGDPIRIVYFFDEFERILAAMPDYFFVALRSIRDRFKGQVMFVTFARNSLTYLVNDERIGTLEPFIELFYDNPVYLGPYRDPDAWRMIEDLEKRSVSQNDTGLGLLIRATGGFAGLLRSGFQYASELADIPVDDYQRAIYMAASRLIDQQNVAEECKTLLRGLNPEEITTLYAVVHRHSPPDPKHMAELELKSLLLQSATTRGGWLVRPPVLAAYIHAHAEPPEARPPAPPVTSADSNAG